MRQFEIFSNPSEATRAIAPYLVTLSSHRLKDVSVVIVAPLLRDRSRPIKELEVAVRFEGERLILSLTDLFSLETRVLRNPVGDLFAEEDAIRRALERLFTGF